MSSLLARYSGALVAEEYWLRLEQVGVQPREPDVAEVAQVMDELYSLNPCEDEAAVTGGQPPETDDEGEIEPPLEQGDFWSRLNELLTIQDCDGGGVRTEELRVYRSHPDEPYKLVVEGGRVVHTVAASDSGERVVAVVGGRLELEPGLSANSVSWSPLRDSIGSVVPLPPLTGTTLASPVTGLARVNYSSSFDLVTIEVPDGDDGEPGECNVLAYYHGAAYELELESPESEPELSATDTARLCLDSLGGGSITRAGSPYCYELVRHNVRCDCSRSISYQHSWESELGVTCPDDIVGEGRHLVGRRDVDAGFVDCGEWDTALSDPDVYNGLCCTALSGVPRICRHKYRIYQGSQGVDVQQLKALYGENARFEPLGPSDGVCGEFHIEYRVNAKRCCDDVVDMTPHPGNPSDIGPGGGVWLQVEDGRNESLEEWVWEATGGLVFANGQSVIVGGRRQQVSAPQDLCASSQVVVEDGCSTLVMNLANAGATPLSLAEGDRVVAPEGLVTLYADGGLAPYYWHSGTLVLISAQGGNSATFEAPADFCGTASVTVSDACGDVAQAGVRSTDGHWIPDPDRPEANSPYCEAWGGEVDDIGYVISGGRRAHVFITYGEEGCGGQVPAYCAPGNFIAEGNGLLSPEDHCLSIFPDSGGTGWFTRWINDCCIRCYRNPDSSETCQELAGFAQAANLFYLWECA